MLKSKMANVRKRMYNALKIRMSFVGRDLAKYVKLSDGEFEIHSEDYCPITTDKKENAGSIDGHYCLQDLYFARMINNMGPDVHYDIGSRVDGFITHLLASNQINKVVLIDIRPLDVHMDKLSFLRDDACSMKHIKDGTIMSISSLHAIEHMGLGRYGDDIDPDGWKKALKNIQKITAEGGHFYLGVPVGKNQKVCFNAHRIFRTKTIMDTLDEMTLVSFAYIHDFKVHEVNLSEMSTIDGKLGDYDCGLFEFEKNRS